jgi:hypothetical protein
MMVSNARRTALLALAVCAAPVSAIRGQTPQQLSLVYRYIKDSVEHLFPVQTQHDTAYVATFDAKTGQLTWRPGLGNAPNPDMILARLKLRPTSRGARPRAKGLGEPAVEATVEQAGDVSLRQPELPVNAINVGLIFTIQNAGPAGVQAVVNGTSYTIPASQASFTAEVKRDIDVDLEIHALPRAPGRHQHFVINHHPYPIVGAFIVQAVPISILYAPPRPGNDSLNWASKGSGMLVSSSITKMLSSSKSQSTNGPSPTQFDDVMTYKNDIKVISEAFGTFVSAMSAADGALGASGGRALENLKSASGGLSSLASTIDRALGSAAAKQTDSSATVSGSTLTVTDTKTTSTTWKTAPGASPGIGDQIFYLKNARFGYAAYYPCASCDVDLFVTPLGSGGADLTTPALLQADLAAISGGRTPASGFSKSTIQFLLSLDPFVGRGDTISLQDLDPTRFVDPQQYPVVQGSSDNELSYTHDVKKDDWKASLTATTIAQQLKPGFLCFLGIGVTDDRCDDQNSTLSVTSTSSTLRETSVGATMRWAVHLQATDPLDKYYVTGYWDSVFGSFAFTRETGTAAEGFVRDVAGQPLAKAGQLVTISSGGRTLTTRTDARGHFSFGGRAFKPGQWMLRVEGGPPQPVLIGRQPVSQDIKRGP